MNSLNTNSIGWTVLIISSICIMYVIVVALTDGRYFGKWLMNRIYDFIGPSIFSAQSEAERWQKLAKNIKLLGDEKILDVGTAVGDLPLTIAGMTDFQGEVIGIDRSEQMIAVAKAKAIESGISKKVKFEVVDVQAGLDYEKGEFDVIICMGLLETLPNAEKILEEFSKILKPNGALVLSLYRGWAAASMALSYDWYDRKLTALGFQELEISPCRRNQDVVIAKR